MYDYMILHISAVELTRIRKFYEGSAADFPRHSH